MNCCCTRLALLIENLDLFEESASRMGNTNHTQTVVFLPCRCGCQSFRGPATCTDYTEASGFDPLQMLPRLA